MVEKGVMGSEVIWSTCGSIFGSEYPWGHSAYISIPTCGWMLPRLKLLLSRSERLVCFFRTRKELMRGLGVGCSAGRSGPGYSLAGSESGGR